MVNEGPLGERPYGGLMEESPPICPIHFSCKRHPLVSRREARIA